MPKPILTAGPDDAAFAAAIQKALDMVTSEPKPDDARIQKLMAEFIKMGPKSQLRLPDFVAALLFAACRVAEAAANSRPASSTQ